MDWAELAFPLRLEVFRTTGERRLTMIQGLASAIAPILVPHGEVMFWSTIYVMYAIALFPVVAVVLILAHDWRKHRFGK